MLDLFHRDCKVNERWVSLHPREFKVLWRLAETPGIAVSRRTLLSDVWRINEPMETKRVEVTIARLRSKLNSYALQNAIISDPKADIFCAYLIDQALLRLDKTAFIAQHP